MKLPQNRRLGKLCPYKHDYRNTGKSLRSISQRKCVVCHSMHMASILRTHVCKNCQNSYSTNQYNSAFCSKSCAATYNNKHKKKGYRRSKLEKYIEKMIKKEYPNTFVLFNDKQAVGSELDIYFPKLKLAVELNGIFHYKPIYGEEKFNKIKKIDQNKILQCSNNNIHLFILDTTRMANDDCYNIIKQLISQM